MRLTVSFETLLVAATVLAAAAGLLLFALVGGTAVSRSRHRRITRIHRELQPRLRQVLVDGSELQSAAWWLSRLPWHQQVSQLGDLAMTLSGETRRRVAALADATGALPRARRRATSRRWQRRLRGARVITLLGSGDTDLASLLADPHPEVRVQAADWVAEHGSADQVAAMLVALDGDPRLGGYPLVDCLFRAGPRAAPALLASLDRGDLRDPVPALTAAVGLADARFADVADRWSRATEPAARASAARLLGAIGDPVAVARLSERLTDEDGAVRTAAAEALGRLRHWPAAPDLAHALSDPVFDVRRAAGLALRRLDAAGLLYLRRGLRSEDGFVADMAMHVLSLPEEVTA